jgi:Glycosyl transferases group 1
MAAKAISSERESPWLRRARTAIKRLVTPDRVNPVLGDGVGGPEDSSHTFVMVCGPGFNVNVPNAASTIRLGFCRGFALAGVRYKLVSVFELGEALGRLRSPFVCLSVYDYENLDARALSGLAETPHIVWINPSFPDLERVYGELNLPDPRLADRTNRRVMAGRPRFLWAPVPPSCLRFYEDWRSADVPIESIPLACDTTRYFPDPAATRFADTAMAFVGGYRAYKDIQYEKYLRPYEKQLAVFGYDHWPYSGYGGLLPDDEERTLYRNARVCPALSEPHAEVMGDIVERPFKIMGSGGLAVTDVIPFYRELFTPDELLVPADMAEYHEMARRALSDEAFNAEYRRRGYEAVVARHSYEARARHILQLLGLSHGA